MTLTWNRGVVIRNSFIESESPSYVFASAQRTEMAISGLLERLKKGLAKTAKLFNIRSWFGRKVDQTFLD